VLVNGKKLGPYEVYDSLGAGGMGEVYRARDTHLDREVAIKILPESFATVRTACAVSSKKRALSPGSEIG
jgi:serine/threonine protein kinase